MKLTRLLEQKMFINEPVPGRFVETIKINVVPGPWSVPMGVLTPVRDECPMSAKVTCTVLKYLPHSVA